MKKLFTIITLFVSSFFFISLKEAKAVEFNKELDFSLLNDETRAFKKQVEDFLSTDETYSDDYIIFYNHKGDSKLYALLMPNSYTGEIYNWITSSYIRYNLFSPSCFYLYTSNDNIVESNYFFVYYDASSLPWATILYSTIKLTLTSDFSLTYTYNDFIYVDSKDTTNKISGLDEIYKEYQKFIGDVEEENPHKEEIEKVESFYSVVIEKLSYLAEEISSNYIYLSIIVIFLLILVFELVFRRYL